MMVSFMFVDRHYMVTKNSKFKIGKLGFEDCNQPAYPKFLMVQAMRGLFVTQVATGDYHTLCLIDNGHVYAWGGTLHKKLGSRAGKPARIEALK